MAQITAAATVALATAPGQRLRADAAAAWDAAARQCAALHGWAPTLTDSFRPVDVQERIFRQRYTTTPTQYAKGKTDRRVWNGRAYYRRPGYAAAAVPGTSNHGSGTAVDAGKGGRSFATFTDQDRARFLAIASRHGWADDEGRRVNEPWHLTYYPDRDTHPNPQEDTMTPYDVWAYKNAKVNGVKDTYALLTGLVNSMAALRKDVAAILAAVKK